MTTSANSETELLTEHFGYPPVSLIDDVINSVNVLAERALNSIEQGLLNASPATLGFKPSKSKSQQDEPQLSPAERAKNEVESGTHQLETLLCASIDRNFDKFELYVLRNIFTVRPPELCTWIRLSHYDGLDFSSRRSRDGNGNDEQQTVVDVPTIESITALRRRLRESMRLNALLTAERARNEALLEDLRRLVGDPTTSGPQVKAEENGSPGAQLRREADASVEETGKKSPFAFLHEKGDLASSGGGAAAPLATTAAFTLSQMQALRALSTALSNLTPDLKISATADTDDDEGASRSRGWRRERAEYVETATRRHLETVHGLELGRHGEVRDGEWQGPGRSLARGEVEGLERVVELLGGDVPAGGEDDAERMDES